MPRGPEMTAPKVFISYSRESPNHEAWVLELAASLRRNGVEASLDQWDLRPGHDMTVFMESQIRDSDFVVLACTPTYAQKSNIPRGGVGYERNIITAEMLQSQDLKPKFLPVLRDGEFTTSLPTYLGSRYAIDVRPSRIQSEALDELLRAIHEVPPSSKPPLGPNPYARG
ncbi:MAG: toll/interleukin-1 receptor domain-containing protein, partial [Gammaproteobacteria bacterium]